MADKPDSYTDRSTIIGVRYFEKTICKKLQSECLLILKIFNFRKTLGTEKAHPKRKIF